MKLIVNVDHAIFIVNELNAVELLLDVGLDDPVQLGQVKLLKHQQYLVAQIGEWNHVGL